MKPLSAHAAHHTLDGTVRVFLAEALLLPTGLITAAFLTRQFGPESYGLFVLAATFVGWVEWGITSIFSRATLKFVGEAEDWRPVGTTIMRLHLAAGIGGMLLLWLLADPIARWLNEPVLVPYLCLFALDIPLHSLAQAHRNILTGIGGFRQRALTSAGRWVGRLLLIVLLVELGFSVPGAILGCIGASLVELAIGRWFVRPSLFSRSSFPVQQVWDYAGPLFLSAVSLSCYSRLDLFMLKALNGTAVESGIYGAAQNLSLLPGIFALSFAPLLLATLSRLLHAGDHGLAREMSRHAMRAVLWLLPAAAMIAGAAPEIVQLFFGPLFLPAAPLLAVLIFGAVASVMLSVATCILIADCKPGWTLALAGPLVPLAVIGHLLLIPRLGAIGASLVTTLLAFVSALAAVLAVYRFWRILPPAGTLARSILLCLLAYCLAALWPATGGLVLVKLMVIGIAIVIGFKSLGEFSVEEMVMLRSVFSLRGTPAQNPHEV
jgi:O-antigen/teichoic acid export membrane protein